MEKSLKKQDNPLNEKQKRFCEEYIIDLNATQAYIRAGYSKNGAEVSAHKLLTNTKVTDYISELKKKQQERTEITADMVIRELALLALSDTANLYNDDGTLKSISSMPSEVTRTISEVTSRTEIDKEGKRLPAEINKIKCYDKKGALDSLARHFGLFEKDNSQLKPEAILNITRNYIGKGD